MRRRARLHETDRLVDTYEAFSSMLPSSPSRTSTAAHLANLFPKVDCLIRDKIKRRQLGYWAGFLREVLQCFAERKQDLFCEHLFLFHFIVSVPSRHGAVIAHKNADKQTASQFQAQFEDFIRQNEPSMRKAAQIRHELAMPENRLPSRFFEAMQLGEVLETVQDVATAKNIAIVAHVQRMVEYIEISWSRCMRLTSRTCLFLEATCS